MEAILSDSHFTDFGVDSLYPFPRTGLRSVEADDPSALREQVRRHVPREPGVYGMVDGLGRLIYVGKSKALKNRLLSYFLPGNEEDKSGRIVQTTAVIVWETQPSEFAALIREQSLIRQLQPRFNVQGIPRRQQHVYVCLGRGPAEQLFVSRRPEPKATYVLGPLAGAGRANRAVEVLNRLYQLRDCSNKQPCSFADQMQLFEIDLRPGCLRLEIATCLGPCISACSRQAYAAQVQRAQAFLAGKDVAAIDLLQASRQQAVEGHHFEQAARIHEDLKAIQWLSCRAADVSLARQRYSFIYLAGDSTGCSPRKVWYLIRHGMIEGALAAPQTSKQWAVTSQLIRQWWTQPDLVGSPFVSRPESLGLVASWFRVHRKELKLTFRPKRDGSFPEGRCPIELPKVRAS